MNLRTILKSASLEDLQAALRYQRTHGKRDKLEAERTDLQRQLGRVEKKLAALDGNGAQAVSKPGRRGRRKGFKVSASTRRKMSEAAKRRYVKADAPTPERRVRKLSAAGRAAISAAAKKRWELARQAKIKETAPAPGIQ